MEDERVAGSTPESESYAETTSAGAPPTVYLVDDDPAGIKSLKRLVETIGLNVQAFSSADEFLQDYRPMGPGCMVLDVRLPGMSGLELQKEMARLGMILPTIVVTGYADVRMAVEAMKTGAMEFLEKPFRSQELCDMIHRAIEQDKQNWDRRRYQREAQERIAQLTPAEREVFDLVVEGKTNKEMAQELGLSVRAVEDRRAKMTSRLQLTSRADLVKLAKDAQGTE